MTVSLFAYGTLRDPEVRRLVLGRDIPADQISEATAAGQRVVFFPGRTYPALRPEAGATATGTLLVGLTPTDLERLDRFEGPEYARGPVDLIVSGAALAADVYWPALPIPAAAADWRLADWQARYKKAFLAREAGDIDRFRANLSAVPR